MSEVVASSCMSQSRTHVFTRRLTDGQAGQGRRKGKSDFRAKKNAIFKRAREDCGQISREALVSVCVTRVLSSCSCLMLLRRDARATLEEVISGSKRDRSMGVLISVLPRRDVRDILGSAFLLS